MIVVGDLQAGDAGSFEAALSAAWHLQAAGH